MSVTAATLLYVSYILTVYIGSLTIIVGLFGNILNILVFTQLKLFRKNPSTFSLTIVSITDCCQLLLTSINRVIPAIFQFNLMQKSNLGCKLIVYIARFIAIISISVVCFAAFDQYLSTSYHHRLRQMSTYRLAKYFVVILLLFAGFYSLPVLIYFDIRPGFGCTVNDSAFNYFNSFIHYCILFGLLPIVIAASFSFLAYRNVRHLIRHETSAVRRRLDRQLTAMILVRAALMIIVSLPFFIYIISRYHITYDRTNQWIVAVLQFISTFLTTIYYFNSSTSFYLFLMTSSRFRRQVKYFFMKKIRPHCCCIRVHRVGVTNRNPLATIETHRTQSEN